MRLSDEPHPTPKAASGTEWAVVCLGMATGKWHVFAYTCDKPEAEARAQARRDDGWLTKEVPEVFIVPIETLETTLALLNRGKSYLMRAE